MDFRTTVTLLILCSGAPNLAVAQTARQIEVGCAITYLGFTGFRLDVIGRFDGDRYDIESHAFKEGVIRAVTINYEARNRAWGNYSSGKVRPAGGSLSLVVGDQRRTWLAQYSSDGKIQEVHQPVWRPTPQQMISDDARDGSLDPLSAALSAAFAGDADCDRTLPSNDGKRRLDILPKKIGSEAAGTADVPGVLGDLQICDLYTKRIAGEFDDPPAAAEGEREEPVKIWMARFDNTQMRYPAKLTASTGLGTIYGALLYFRERPLSNTERDAMRR
jgi:hypothetical protein